METAYTAVLPFTFESRNSSTELSQPNAFQAHCKMFASQAALHHPNCPTRYLLLPSRLLPKLQPGEPPASTAPQESTKDDHLPGGGFNPKFAKMQRSASASSPPNVVNVVPPNPLTATLWNVQREFQVCQGKLWKMRKALGDARNRNCIRLR